QIVALVQPLVIGRNPPSDVEVAGEAALAVRLPDPGALLSRVHLESRLVDWQVQVVDRDSVNHTYVEPPGLPSTQLRAAEPFPIPPDTVVRLGEATTFTYRVGP